MGTDQWISSLLWIHGLSDAIIAISYIWISILLIYFVNKRKNLPFRWLFMAFGVFVFACGGTHIMAVVTIWKPVYWLSGGVKVVTMLVSVGTAITLAPLMPKMLTIPTPSELLQVNNELTNVNKELEAFSYSVSHDLRAPLRSMDGFSKFLLRDYNDKLDEKGKDFLNRIRNASQRMAELIAELLKLSRVTRSELTREPVDLSGLAYSIRGDLKNTDPKRQVEFVIEEGLVVKGDKLLLRQVMVNLMGNAWKYTRKATNTKIEFGVTQRDGEKTYFVRDNGAGFDMTYADKLFGAFQRLHSTDEFKGIGIGLATVKRIINRHGGCVWGEGKVNEGATFYFNL